MFILWKESLKSDGKKIHQYQQNEELPTFHLKSVNIIKTTTYDVGNPGPGLGQAQKSGRSLFVACFYLHIHI